MMRICLRSTRARGISLLQMFILILTTLNDGLLVLSTPTASSSLSGINGRLQTRNKMHLQRNIDTSFKFPCKEPQARAYNLQDLMQNLGPMNPSEATTKPVYSVLKRCDVHSGCCMSTLMSCTPVPASTYFEDIEIEIWNMETNKSRTQWIRVEQHGKCSCEDTKSSERERLATQKPIVWRTETPSGAWCLYAIMCCRNITRSSPLNGGRQ